MIELKQKDILQFLKESNAIEGVTSRAALNDAIQAWNYAVDNKNNITSKYILKIHFLLMRTLRPDIAGKVRTCDVFIGGKRKSFISEYLLKEQIKFWLKECNTKTMSMRSESERENAVKEWHVKFEFLHPFEDGNGRVGRFLYQIHRLKTKLPLYIIKAGGQEQLDYYKWFK